MKLLAFETAGDACSSALLVDGRALERHCVAPRRHAELALDMARSLLEEAGMALVALDVIAFGRGPGSFTGVRVATGVAQGLAFGADLPVAPVSSLQALAQGALREHARARVLAAFDARMGEVYWGAYEAGAGGLMTVRIEDCLAPPAAVPVPEGGEWTGVGEGWAAHARALGARLGGRLSATEPHRLARALDVAMLAERVHARGESVAAQDALPVYVRDRVARKRDR